MKPITYKELPPADDTRVVRGSGNVFADLGFENPEAERNLARQLREARAAKLDAALARGLADAEAGRVRPIAEVRDRLRAKYQRLAAERDG